MVAIVAVGRCRFGYGPAPEQSTIASLVGATGTVAAPLVGSLTVPAPQTDPAPQDDRLQSGPEPVRGTALGRDDVAHLARLARIALSDDELDELAPQLDLILSSVAQVSEVAGADVVPTSHPVPITNVFREDVLRPRLTAEQALASAPAVEDQRFRVPRILDEEA
jgi:aspartyl-tRNA(Asn)/glutamyl-tRNA(Gln) amidotransferase subunit C